MNQQSHIYSVRSHLTLAYSERDCCKTLIEYQVAYAHKPPEPKTKWQPACLYATNTPQRFDGQFNADQWRVAVINSDNGHGQWILRSKSCELIAIMTWNQAPADVANSNERAGLDWTTFQWRHTMVYRPICLWVCCRPTYFSNLMGNCIGLFEQIVN